MCFLFTTKICFLKKGVSLVYFTKRGRYNYVYFCRWGEKPWNVRNMPKGQEADQPPPVPGRGRETSPAPQGSSTRLHEEDKLTPNKLRENYQHIVRTGVWRPAGVALTPSLLPHWGPNRKGHPEGGYYRRKGRFLFPPRALPFPLWKSSPSFVLPTATLACLPGFAILGYSRINPFSLVKWVAVLFLRLTTLLSRKRELRLTVKIRLRKIKFKLKLTHLPITFNRKVRCCPLSLLLSTPWIPTWQHTRQMTLGTY